MDEQKDNVFDCIVVGAGIEGSCTARYASSIGKKTLCLEQFPLPHDRGSSHGQTRITRHGYVQEYHSVMMPEAYVLWSEIERMAKEQLFVKTGCVFIDNPPYTYSSQTATSLEKLGIPGELLEAKQLQERYGFKYPAEFVGILEKQAGILLANKCLRAIQEQFVRFGGVMKDNEKVLEITPGNIVTVKTNKRIYKSSTLILTPGPWATKLLKPLGIDLPLKAERVTYFYHKIERDGFKVKDNFPMWIHYTKPDPKTFSGLFYGFPSFEFPNLVKIGTRCTVECDPDARDKVDNPQAEKNVSEYIARHMIGVEVKPCLKESCIYTVSPDSNYTMDRHPKYKNIVIGVGFSGAGFKKAPVIGKMLTQLAFGFEPSYNIDHAKIDRFQNIPKSSL